jgi:uncharacterized protein YaeQ
MFYSFTVYGEETLMIVPCARMTLQAHSDGTVTIVNLDNYQCFSDVKNLKVCSTAQECLETLSSFASKPTDQGA